MPTEDPSPADGFRDGDTMPPHLSAPALERKFTPLGTTPIDADGTFSGYASLFDVVDLGRDRVRRGAFARSLAKRGAAGVRMLWQHDPGEPIGVWVTIEEDAKGLLVHGRLEPAVERGRAALVLLRRGALDGLSIGFRAARSAVERGTRIRDLVEIDLWEISLVTFPMLPDARVARVKGGRPDEDRAATLMRRAASSLRSNPGKRGDRR
jgi:HK97 family phage prohead protease